MTRPDRQAMYDAPVLPEIPTRFVYRPQTATYVMSGSSSLWETGRAAARGVRGDVVVAAAADVDGATGLAGGAPFPPPMNMCFVPNTMPTTDAMHAGSSVPRTLSVP